MRRLLRRLGLLVLVVGAGYAGYRWGPTVIPGMQRATGGERAGDGVVPLPSAELADSTLDRFERFRTADGPERLVLSGREVTSVLRFALPGLVPPGVDEPLVELEEDRVRLSARVAVDAFPRLPRLEQVLGMLPDTVGVLVEGPLVPYDRVHLALMVERMEAARIPLPRRLVGEMLAGFGREAPRGFPEEALVVPLPDGIEAVYVRRDSLVLVAERSR